MMNFMLKMMNFAGDPRAADGLHEEQGDSGKMMNVVLKTMNSVS